MVMTEEVESSWRPLAGDMGASGVPMTGYGHPPKMSMAIPRPCGYVILRDKGDIRDVIKDLVDSTLDSLGAPISPPSDAEPPLAAARGTGRQGGCCWL